MKKITLLIVFLFALVGFSQTNKQIIQGYLEANRAKTQLTSQDVSNWIFLGEQSSTSTGITNYNIAQSYNGVEIFDTQSNAWVKNDAVIKIENRFKSNVAQKANSASPTLSVTEALQRAFSNLEVAQTATFSVTATEANNTFVLSSTAQQDPINAKLVFVNTADNKLKLAWSFQLFSLDTKHYWDIRVDAASGTILEKRDLMISCNFGEKSKNQAAKGIFSFEKSAFNNKKSSLLVATPGNYRVIPFNYESPNHHPFELVTTAGDVLASPNGWHNANTLTSTNAALKFTYTRGNNVIAQEDANGDNLFATNGVRTDGGATLNFDFPFGGPTLLPAVYTPAATTNLFYVVNSMHDVWYHYGFDEANHNYQQSSYSRGGTASVGPDNVQADSQDGYSQTTPTLNNANFAPTNDGTRPRLQMYMWTLNAPPTDYITVNSPSTIAGPRAATSNVFNTTDSVPVPAAPNGITSDLVLYDNNPAGAHSACQPATNAFDLSGKIALIKRGGCFFNLKVKNAQDAGAIAVIMMDSIPNNPSRLNMSSTGVLGITIPAIFITKEIGDSFIAEMANGPVNVKLEIPANLYLYGDGDFDNLIIAHEYGHGISNRLVSGGSTGCMTNAEQMGEGWSDWFGLIMQMKAGETGAESRGVGTYVVNQPTTGVGIRSVPYSTDMSICPLTLVNSNDVEVHNLGEAWAATLWDLAWAYVRKYGFDPDVYNGTGGNNKVMRLVLDALKLQGCNTASYISGRDNIFAADQASTGGVDYCLIADVFTRRGMGLNATSGLATNALDQVEDFTPFPAGPNCTLAVNYFEANDMIRIYPNPTNGMLNVRVNQFVGSVNIQVVDLNGRIVFATNATDFNVEKTIDLSQLQKGIYVLKVSGEGLNYNEKIILR